MGNLLEKDGLFWESETHEWYKDMYNTRVAQMENLGGISLPDIAAFVIKNKSTGEYDRILFDQNHGEIIFDTKKLEVLGGRIDMMKIAKQFQDIEENDE
jgi:hypothetical protein